MVNSPKATLNSLSTIADACVLMDQLSVDHLPVLDWKDVLVGHVSDFEVRKFIVGGGSYQESIARVMSPPAVGQTAPTKFESAPNLRDNLVVLMVGGAGTRLRPLTDNCPKPLLPVKGKPLLERTIEHLASFGFHRFCFAVGYMADKIIDHFRDGSDWGVSIDYIREEKRLGTCGALRLLQSPPQETVLVMNGDLITGVRYDNLLEYHRRAAAQATLCVSPYEVAVPYGVVECDGINMSALKEKPVHRYWISAGMYLLEPEAIGLIPADGNEHDMPNLLQDISSKLGKVAVYPIRETWIDIGSVEEYTRANADSTGIVTGALSPQYTVDLPQVTIDSPVRPARQPKAKSSRT